MKWQRKENLGELTAIVLLTFVNCCFNLNECWVHDMLIQKKDIVEKSFDDYWLSHDQNPPLAFIKGISKLNIFL